MSKKRKSMKLTDFFANSKISKVATVDSETRPQLQTEPTSSTTNVERAENVQYCPVIEGGKPFHPPETFLFPKRKFETRNRSFQAHWTKDFNWIHYDQK